MNEECVVYTAVEIQTDNGTYCEWKSQNLYGDFFPAEIYWDKDDEN